MTGRNENQNGARRDVSSGTAQPSCDTRSLDAQSRIESEFISIFDNFIRQKSLLTVEELAVVLKVSEKTVRDWILKGKIPLVRPQKGTVRFNPLTVARWLAERSEYAS